MGSIKPCHDTRDTARSCRCLDCCRRCRHYCTGCRWWDNSGPRNAIRCRTRLRCRRRGRWYWVTARPSCRGGSRDGTALAPTGHSASRGCDRGLIVVLLQFPGGLARGVRRWLVHDGQLALVHTPDGLGDKVKLCNVLNDGPVVWLLLHESKTRGRQGAKGAWRGKQGGYGGEKRWRGEAGRVPMVSHPP
jgi:hypothetical protein